MSRFATTRAGRWGVRQEEADMREAMRLASLKSNPRQVVENIISRALIVAEVSRQMLSNSGDTPAALQAVAARWCIPVETVQECISIDTLETGK